MNVNKQGGLWLLAGMVWTLACGTAVADDTELFVVDSSQFPQARPNVLLIMDTSGSMQEVVESQASYDPSILYDGPCETDRVYWRRGHRQNPPDCDGGDDWVYDAVFYCDAARQAFGTAGYFIDRMMQYDWSREDWRRLNDETEDNPVECREDAGKHGNGVDTDKVYAQDDDDTALWTANAADETRWGRRYYTVYDSNFLNWYHGPANEEITRIQVVKDVASNLLDTVNGINVGLMRFNQNTSSWSSGGPVIHAVEDIATGREVLKDTINSLPANGNTPLAETMYEAAHYYGGLDVVYGDRDAPESSVPESRTADPSIYKTPIEYACQKNFVVYLSDGQPTQDTDGDDMIEDLIGGNCSGNCLDEVAEYLYETDQSPDGYGLELAGLQNVVTHTIGFSLDIPVLEEAAQKGGGQYFRADNTAELSAVLTRIVTDILETQTTFTSPTVSINSFNRTQHLNDLYITMFEPAETMHWPGNLKKYRLRASDATIVDANGEPAIENAFFADTAQSFWSAAVDGSSVTQGGAANEIPDPAARNVYTCLDCSSSRTALPASGNQVHQDNAALDTTVLGIGGSDDPSRDALIDFVRGVDVTNVDGDSDTAVRYEMGDPLHAQPATIMYGENESVIYFATNDGYLHAIDTADGSERWAFIPEEFLPDMADLYRNENTPGKRYGIDGSLRLQVIADSDGTIEPAAGERVYLYFGLRRGGDTYYALDVTDPSNPEFLWKRSSSDFALGLGQTWSNPVPTRINVDGGSYSGPNGANEDQLALVFGAGYDTGHDQPGMPTAPDSGNGILIVDALNGNLLWHATEGGGDMTGTSLDNMNYSFAGDIKVVDLDGDRFADRMYAADMGGQVWRFDVFNANTVDALVHGGVIAQLGGAPASDPPYADTRRFYYSPDVALVSNDDHNFMHIGIGSGHRASPNSTQTHDRFYALRDHNPFNSLTQAEFNARELDPIVEDDLVEIRDELEPTIAPGDPGWRMELRVEGSTSWVGEKVLAEARTFDNTVFFTSFTPGGTPSADDCRPRLGTNRLYQIDLFTGAPVTNLDGSADEENLTVEDRYIEFGGSIASEPVFLFPSPDDPENCVGDECTPPPVACVDLFCFPPGFQNNPVRTFWSQENLDE